MILSGDFNAPCCEVFHRLIAAMMAKRQFVSSATERQPHQLMAEADSKNRITTDWLSQIRNDSRKRLGIARTVRQPDSIRLQIDDVFRRSVRGNYRNAATKRSKVAKAVVLKTKVVGDDVETRFVVSLRCVGMKQYRRSIRRSLSIGPHIGLFASDDRSEIESDHFGGGASSIDHCLLLCFLSRKAPAHRASFANVSHERARVDVRYSRNTGVL